MGHAAQAIYGKHTVSAQLQTAVLHGGNGGALTVQQGVAPLFFQVQEGLNIGQCVIQSSADGAQEHEIPVSPLQTQLDSQHHIGIVLHHGMTDDFLPLGDIPQRVKIAHHQIGSQSQGFQRGISAVSGDDQIFRGTADLGLFCVPGTQDITNTFHQSLPSSLR